MDTVTRLKHAIRRVGQEIAPAATLAVLANRPWLQEPEMKLLGALATGSGFAIDVGANKGVYMTHLARHFAKVVAFEPLPELARFLRLAAPKNVTVFDVALSSKGGDAQLLMPDDFDELASLETSLVEHRETGTNYSSFNVKRATLDSYDFKNVDLIKIDVEGHEEEVLSGAEKTIAASRPSLLIEVEERHAPGAVSRVCAKMESLDYSGFYLDGKETKPMAMFDAARDQAAALLKKDVRVGRYINNLIFFPRERAAERLAAISASLAHAY